MSLTTSGKVKDLGVHLYLVGDPTGITYKNPSNVTTPAGTLLTTYVGGAVFSEGQAHKFQLTVEMQLAVATEIWLKLEGRRLDPLNPTLFTHFCVEQLVAMDDASAWTGTTFNIGNSVTAGEVQFKPQAAAGPGGIVLYTTNEIMTGEMVLSAKAVAPGAMGATDYIAVSVDALVVQ